MARIDLGACQPVGDDFAGSSIKFRAGRNLIRNLGWVLRMRDFAIQT